MNRRTFLNGFDDELRAFVRTTSANQASVTANVGIYDLQEMEFVVGYGQAIVCPD
jgi:hypothetical protein